MALWFRSENSIPKRVHFYRNKKFRTCYHEYQDELSSFQNEVHSFLVALMLNLFSWKARQAIPFKDNLNGRLIVQISEKGGNSSRFRCYKNILSRMHKEV